MRGFFFPHILDLNFVSRRLRQGGNFPQVDPNERRVQGRQRLQQDGGLQLLPGRRLLSRHEEAFKPLICQVSGL